jgi:hypothetical protein
MATARIHSLLSNGISQEILCFSETEHRIIWRRTFIESERHKPTRTTKVSIMADYEDLTASAIRYDVEITRHDKRGKEYMAGVDISPNSHLFLQLSYVPGDKCFNLSEIARGARVVSMDMLAQEGLIPSASSKHLVLPIISGDVPIDLHMFSDTESETLLIPAHIRQ